MLLLLLKLAERRVAAALAKRAKSAAAAAADAVAAIHALVSQVLLQPWHVLSNSMLAFHVTIVLFSKQSSACMLQVEKPPLCCWLVWQLVALPPLAAAAAAASPLPSRSHRLAPLQFRLGVQSCKGRTAW